MLPDPEDQNELTPTVFESWYETMEMEKLIFDPLYRNLLNTSITLNLNSHLNNRYAIQDRRLDALVIPQIESFLIELTALEEDTITKKKFAYLKLYIRTSNTKDSNSDIRFAEIRLGAGATYTLSELIDGSMLSLYDLPPLMLFQVKEVDTSGCKVKIGPVESLEI